jgi:hypothetical protein
MGAFHATGQLVPKDLTKWSGTSEPPTPENPRATVNLAVMYATGEGVLKDADYATELFDLAEYMGQDVNTVRQSVGL